MLISTPKLILIKILKKLQIVFTISLITCYRTEEKQINKKFNLFGDIFLIF